ncbi:hypothetical protein SDC9_146502 [bioreactor metagenome]|uniref:Uncharacterized protein n=1 Tax=bioreactor metagenome TaxID=1076179 RepID=A0A645ED80_9ZZZZ
MRGVGVNHEGARAVGGRQRRLHRLDIVQRNALILAAVKAEHRCMQFGGNIQRVLRVVFGGRTVKPAIPCHASLQPGVMCGIQPGDATAPAETGDRQTIGVPALAGRPGGAGVEIGHDLSVGDLGDDARQDGPDVVEGARVALADEQFWRDRQIAEFGKAPANIPDVFVHPENFLYHQHDGQILAACRAGKVDRKGGAGDIDGGVAGVEAAVVGPDQRAGLYRLDCQRKTGCRQSGDKFAAVQLRGGQQTVEITVLGSVGFGHQGVSFIWVRTSRR